jgi:hypothetical protein
MTHPSSRECLVQEPRHIPVIAGRGPILLPNHIVYIQLWNKELLQHIEVHATRYGSIGGKEWSVNLRSANSTENIHLRTFRQLGVDSVIPRWLDYGDSPSLASERKPRHWKQFCPKTNCPLRGGSAYRYESLSDVIDHAWDVTITL